MPAIEQFLGELHQQGIKLWLDGGQLRSRAPKGVMTEVLREALRARRDELTSYLAQASTTRGASPPLRPTTLADHAPLSFPQQRLWLVELLEGSEAVHHPRRAIRMRGQLDLPALRRALDELVRRHEILRTRFEVREGAPVQVIEEPYTVNLPILSVDELDPSDRDDPEVSLRALAERWARTPLSLERLPLWRVGLVVRGPREHVLFYLIHHIISDGWSNQLFMKELCALYEAFTRGRPSPLRPLDLQYRDFACWQRRSMGALIEEQLSYWTQQLGGERPTLALPSDRERGRRQSFRGRSLRCVLPQATAEAVRALGAREGCSFSMTVLAAFEVLLFRYTDQEDLIVGMPVSGRHRPELEGLLGFFVNTLALRTRLAPKEGFRAQLRRVRQTMLDALAHQDVPFERLVEELEPERDLSRTPLFQAWFNVLNLEDERFELSGLTVDKLPLFERSAMFDLSLYVFEKRGAPEVGLRWVYNADLFSEARMQRMAAHFEVLLAAIVAAPDAPIATLALLTETERRQLLERWSSSPELPPAHLWVHRSIEAQARRRPQATALICDGTTVSYAELNGRANQLAAHLRDLGVDCDAVVGVCLDRSASLAVAILAVLKAGAAYLPLDPAQPGERLSAMLADARVAVLVSSRELATRLGDAGGTRVYVDELWAILERRSGMDLPALAGAPGADEQLAYVIYTSGSSGAPKGVMVSHENLSHSLEVVNTAFAISDRDVCLHGASIAFGSSARQLLAPLARGAVVVLLTQEQLRDPWLLMSVVREQRVTVMELVPSHWRVVTDALGSMPASQRAALLDGGELRCLVSVGEPLPAEIPTRWRERFGHPARFINGYGQTEARPVLFHVLPGANEPSRSGEQRPIVPIGRPVGNVRIYVLDRQLQPVPIGVPGELCIGGPVVARGYLRRPQLSARAFTADPFAEQLSARLYRTGDLVRWAPGGELEFMGRRDHQIKLRGVRIELGEIEAALRRHPAVRDAVVLLSGARQVDQRLIAYVLTNSPSRELPDQLREFVRPSLSEPMMPAEFVLIDEFPTTPSGKVDRRALAECGPACRTPRVWLHTPNWHRAPLSGIDEAERCAAAVRCTWIIFCDPNGLCDGIAARLRALGATVLTVRPGQALTRLASEDFMLAPTSEDIGRLLTVIVDQERGPIHVVHGWPLADPGPTPADVSEFHALLALTRALHTARVEARLTVLSERMQELRADDPLYPERATLLGLCRVVALEQPELHCRSVDVSRPRSPTELAAAADALADELLHDDREALVAYRGGERHVERIEAVPALESSLGCTRLRERGVYLITGGLGGIGLALADELVRTVEARIVLVARSGPEAHPGAAVAIEHWRALAGEALCVRADVTCVEQMERVRTLVLERFGQLDGIIHAAGLLGEFELCHLKDEGRMHEVMAPKLQGSRVLERVFGELQLDFWCLCSSFSAIQGRLGQVDYCAANAFLDLFARQRARTGTFAVSINWDTWKQVGMAAAIEGSFSLQAALPEVMDYAIAPQEGVEMFAQVLSGSLSQVIASKRAGSGVPPNGARPEGEAPRSAAKGPDAGSKIQARVAAIWSELLGVSPDQLAQEANFFSLGGHSLLAVRMISRVREVLGVELPLRMIFESPTLAGFSNELAGVRAVQRLTIAPAPRDRPLPLSFPQLRLWLLEQLDGPLVAYNMLVARRLLGALDVVALAESLFELVRRHESLRTTFEATEGEPRQVVHEPLPLVLDRSSLAEAGEGTVDQEAELIRLALEQVQRPFDLETGPLLRACLVELNPEHHVLLLVQHHIISDAWSCQILLRELFTIYESLRTGRPSGLAPLALQYPDYAVWQRARSGELHQRQLEYWTRQLAGPLPVLLLPRDESARPDALCSNGAQITTQLLPELADSLRALARRTDTTLFMVLLAAFDVLLAYYTGEEDIIVGTPSAGRDHTELEAQIGFFVNTLALRVRVSRSVSFEELLGQVRRVTLDAQVNQDVPFERIVDALGVDRGLERSPIFQVWINMTEVAPTVRELEQLRIEKLRLFKHMAMFELSLYLYDRGAEGISTRWVYDTGSFCASRIEGMSRHYQRLLACLVEAPTVALDQLSFMSAAERRRLRARVEPSGSPQAAKPAVVAQPNSKPARRELLERLVAIWAEVLGVAQVNPSDDFFDAGGNSLLAVQVIARVRRSFSIELPLRALFERRTLAGLCDAIAQARCEVLPAIIRAPREGDLPLTWQQARLWRWQQRSGDQYPYQLAIVRRIEGELDVAALAESFSLLVRRHETLRTSFPTIEGQPRQRIHAPEALELRTIELSSLSEQARQRRVIELASEHAFAPFDLASGPLWRIALLRLEPQVHLLLLTFHHITMDGWSLRRLFKEWSALYRTVRNDDPSPLSAPKLQYADYARWQRELLHARPELVEAHLSYWRQQLPERLCQPSPRAGRVAPAGLVAGTLPRSLVEGLEALGRAQHATLFMTMLAAFTLLLHLRGEEREVLVGCPSAGRVTAELEPVLGYFVSPLPIRVHFGAASSFTALLRQVRQRVLGALTHQQVPFDYLASELWPGRELEQDATFSAWFNMLNFTDEALRLPPARVTKQPLLDETHAAFDLSLLVRESSNADLGSLRLVLTFKRERFSATEASHLLAQYQHLLKQVIAEPERQLRLPDLARGSTMNPTPPPEQSTP